MKGSVLIACWVLATLYAAEEQCSDGRQHSVLAAPASACGNTEVNVPICNAVSAVGLCSNITVNGVARDGESYLMELANGSVQLVVLSSQVVRALSEYTSLAIAKAIIELTGRFGWSRITIVADIADTYLLHTAEVFYRIANLSSDSNLLQLGDSHSEVKALVNKIDRFNLKIIVLSLRPQLVSKLLCGAFERHLVWPEYAWIVHSVEVREERCGDNSTLDGIITVKLKDSHAGKQQHCHHDTLLTDGEKPLHTDGIQYLDSCSISTAPLQTVISQQIGHEESIDNETAIVRSLPHPSDLPPLYVATAYIALLYTATTVCFIICTIMLVLFVCFRNEPAVKATSVSLSILIFIGCYLMILYLYTRNSHRLPSLYKQSSRLRQYMCTSFTTLNGVGFPMALILSTVLVKLIRIHRLFKLKGRVSKFTTSNLALAVCALLLTLPNALISLIWSTVDPYTSAISFTVRDGFLHANADCVSTHSLRWALLLLVYILVLSLLLIVFAVLTRKIKYHDFKDTKKISVLSFLLVFTCVSTLFYWYLFNTIRSGPSYTFVNTALNVGHYCIILECQAFIFAPKLFPVIKKRLMYRYYSAANIPTPKSIDRNTNTPYCAARVLASPK